MSSSSSRNSSHRIASSNRRAITVIRIGVGLLFLIFGEYKVFGTQFTLGGGFAGWITRFIANHGAYPFMVPILQGFVLPFKTAIAFLVAYGELAIGLALVTGILVRTASVCGAIYMLALLFSSNYPGPQAPLWQYFGASLDHSVLALCFASLALSEPPGVLLVRHFARGEFRNDLDASALRTLQRSSPRAPAMQGGVPRR
jgi:thiosulfate dehydrogenase [quinone] large subunit